MSNIITQPIVRTGWVLTKDGKFWGVEREGDGHMITTYGWTDDLSKVCISERLKCPHTKAWFTHPNSPYIDTMRQGEWMFVNLKTEYTLEHLISPTKKGK